ncbi:MAG TPA: M48 family metallopeptidase, partial [Elusimicrobiota bacterium]|nr:M48 family metallopeptidase [Elusimicrobiota bacterium]
MKKLCAAFLASILVALSPGSGALAAVARAPRASAPAAVPAVGALGGELGSAPMSAAFGDGLLAAPGFGLTSDGSIGPEGLTVAAPQDAAFTLVMPTGQPFPQTQATSIVSPEALAPAALSGPETYASVSASNVRAAAPETPLAAAMEPLRTLAHAVADGAARFSGLGRQFDGSRAHDGDAAPEAEQAVEAAIPEKPLPGTGENGRESLQESAQGLFRLRHDVQVDAREILKENLGGDFGDGILHRDVGRVLRRLLAAAGYPREAAQVFIGNSFLPNAFTTVVPSEGKFLSENASVARVFRIANIFVSLGLLRSMENESQLAFVLAHELMHNWKGHLKDFSGAGHVFLGHFHELEADAEALKLVAAAGYDAHQAIDSLYALHREYDRLEREYALLKQDKSELTQALSRLRDIHPHPDIRRANMLDHMNEALEQYKPQPVPADPIWMRRRQAEERPSNLDRLGRRLEKAAEGKTIEEAIFDLEVFIEREMEHGELAYEGWAVVEEAYRRLVRRAQNPEDLRPIEVSIRRQEDYSGGFPSRRLKSDLITRQLDMTLAKIARMSPKAAAAPAKAQVPHIAGREQLALAFQTASALSFEEKDRASFGAAQSAAVKLWRAARTVLAAELGREPVPEEIEAELTRGLPAAWAKPIRLASDADPVNRELAPILRALGPSATLADFVAAAEGRSEKARRAGILWSLDRVRDRDGLKAALKAVSALPGLERLERGPNTAFALDASHRLWRAARRALSQEPEADRSPEKIRALLVAGLPAAWRAVVERAGAREKRLPPPSPVAGREAPGLNDFLGSSARLGHESRLAGTLRLLGSIHDRRTLDAAFQTLSREAENLGLDLQQVAMEDMYGGGSVAELVLRVASQLWRGTRTVLTRELGRPALPEEIIDELRKKLSPTWMRSYREGFHVEVLESAFGPEQFRSKTLRPSELVMRLHGRQDSYKQEEHWKKGRKIPGFDHWTLRHYSPPIGGVINGKPVFRYERYYLSGLSSPRLEDQLDILWTFDAGEAPSPAMIALLRREGKLDAFLQAALAELGAEFSRRIAGAANLAERRKHLSWYEDWVTQLLGRALYGVRDFGEIRRNVESIWEPVSALMDSKEVVEAYKDSTRKADSTRTADSTRSHMADQFFQVMSIALRQAVIATDMAGARPEREELAKTAELVARIEKTLRPFPSQALVVAHARNLDRHLGSEQGYMKAYHWAIKNAVVVKEGSRFERWLKGHHNWFMTPVAQLIKFFYYSWKWAWGVASKLWRQRTLPGIPVEHMRSLLSQDFVHFMGLVGDPATDVRTKLMAVALLDRIDVGYDLGEDVFGRDVKMRAAASVGRWLLEDVSAEAKDSDLPGIASGMLKITDRHPGLLQPDLETKGTLENAFRTGAEFIKRNEAYRSLAKGEHPFRAVNTRWALAFAA